MLLRLRSRPRLRKSPRKPRLELRPEDFDNLRYRVELVRLEGEQRATNGAGDGEGVDRAEVALALALGLSLLGACAALGVALDLDVAHEDARLLLPMLALPLGWLLALHLYERATSAAAIVPPVAHS